MLYTPLQSANTPEPHYSETHTPTNQDIIIQQLQSINKKLTFFVALAVIGYNLGNHSRHFNWYQYQLKASR